MTPSYRIVDAVFERSERSRSQAALAAVSVALLVHAAFWWWARRREPSLEEWSAALAARIHAELARREVVDLLPPPPAPNPPPPDQAQQPPVRARSPRVPRAKSSPPPAQAGRIIAQEPRPDAPVDLTQETFVTGRADAYAGGTTSATGTNRVAVPFANVDPNARPTNHPGEPDHSRVVALNDAEWRCPWPAEADSEQIDEQVGSSRVDLQACKLEYSIVSPK